MPFFAAIIMTCFYIVNLPITAAFVVSDKGCAAAFRPVSPASALKAAKQAAKSNKKKAPKKSSRLLMPLRTFETAKNLLPYINLEYFRINARVGLDDAAFTALFAAFLTSAAHIINCRAEFPGKISVTPDFNNPCLEGEICAAVSVPVRFVLKAAALAAMETDDSTPIIRILRLCARICRLQNGHNKPTGG